MNYSVNRGKFSSITVFGAIAQGARKIRQIAEILRGRERALAVARQALAGSVTEGQRPQPAEL